MRTLNSRRGPAVNRGMIENGYSNMRRGTTFMKNSKPSAEKDCCCQQFAFFHVHPYSKSETLDKGEV